SSSSASNYTKQSRRFLKKEEARSTVLPQLHKACHKLKLCKRCGKSNHWWGICQSEATLASIRATAPDLAGGAASGRKPKAEANAPKEKEDKKVKVAEVKMETGRTVDLGGHIVQDDMEMDEAE